MGGGWCVEGVMTRCVVKGLRHMVCSEVVKTYVCGEGLISKWCHEAVKIRG